MHAPPPGYSAPAGTWWVAHGTVSAADSSCTVDRLTGCGRPSPGRVSAAAIAWASSRSGVPPGGIPPRPHSGVHRSSSPVQDRGANHSSQLRLARIVKADARPAARRGRSPRGHDHGQASRHRAAGRRRRDRGVGNSAAWPPLATSEPPPWTGSSRPSTTSRLPTPARRPPSCSAGYAATSPMSLSSWRRAKPWPSTGGCWSRAAGCRCSPRRARSTCDGGAPHRPGCARPRSSPARPVTPRRVHGDHAVLARRPRGRGRRPARARPARIVGRRPAAAASGGVGSHRSVALAARHRQA
jgi:hypothetical protein